MITIQVHHNHIVKQTNFNCWDEAMDFAHSNDWSIDEVLVIFTTNGNFRCPLPLATFTQSQHFVK